MGLGALAERVSGARTRAAVCLLKLCRVCFRLRRRRSVPLRSLHYDVAARFPLLLSVEIHTVIDGNHGSPLFFRPHSPIFYQPFHSDRSRACRRFVLR